MGLQLESKRKRGGESQASVVDWACRMAGTLCDDLVLFSEHISAEARDVLTDVPLVL